MVRPGAIVTQAFAGERAQEDCAGMLEQRLPAVRIAAGHFQVQESTVLEGYRFVNELGVPAQMAAFLLAP